MAHRVGLLGIDSIAFAGRPAPLPAFPFELLVGYRFGILLRQHLGQDAVAQPQIRVDEAGQREALQQFGVDMCACYHDFRSSGTNARDTASLRALFILVSLLVSRRTFRVSTSGLLRGARPLPVLPLRIDWLACASAAAVPEVAITSETRIAVRNAVPPYAVREQ